MGNSVTARRDTRTREVVRGSDSSIKRGICIVGRGSCLYPHPTPNSFFTWGRTRNEEERNWRGGKCSVRVSYCVWSFVVDMECKNGVARAYRVANEDVAIECSV